MLRCACAHFEAVRSQSGMAAADLDAVISLTAKADELLIKGHYERSLLKWRAALTAAETHCAEDCIILAAVTTKFTRSSVVTAGLRSEPMDQAFVLKAFALYSASAATLRRRRDAGTLLQGMCRPDEMRWQRESLRAGLPITVSDAEMQAAALLVGYDGFLELTNSCIQLLCIALTCRVFTPGGDAERTWLAFTCDLCDDAVALMILPRELNRQGSIENTVFLKLKTLKEELRTGLAHRFWHVRVDVALARLRQSGVLEERDLGGAQFAHDLAYAQQCLARGVQERCEAAASGRLRACALSSCGAKEAHPSHFSKCGACKAVAYCCREHQQADWPAHKAACKAARKPAAAKDAA